MLFGGTGAFCQVLCRLASPLSSISLILAADQRAIPNTRYWYSGLARYRLLGGHWLNQVRWALEHASIKINNASLTKPGSSYPLSLGPSFWVLPDVQQSLSVRWGSMFRQQKALPGHVALTSRGLGHRRWSKVEHTLPTSLFIKPTEGGEVVTQLALWPLLSLFSPERSDQPSRLTPALALDTGFFFPDHPARRAKLLGFYSLRNKRYKKRQRLVAAPTALSTFGPQTRTKRRLGSLFRGLLVKKNPSFTLITNQLRQTLHRAFSGVQPRIRLRLSRLVKPKRLTFAFRRLLKHRPRFSRYRRTKLTLFKRCKFPRFFKHRGHLRHWRFTTRRHLKRWNTVIRLKKKSTHIKPLPMLGSSLRKPDFTLASPASPTYFADQRWLKATPPAPVLQPGLVGDQTGAANWALERPKPERELRQAQVRYKPGFMTYWRIHRLVFRKAFWLPFGRRQKRLTAYIVRLRRVATFSYFRLLQLALYRVVLQSHLLSDMLPETAWRAVLGGLFSVNGLSCANPLYQLYTTDLVSCNLAARPSQAPVIMPRLRSSLYGLDRSRIHEGQQDAPSYLEVDELCAAVFILHEPQLGIVDLSRWAPMPTPFLTLKCYNWKYIT